MTNIAQRVLDHRWTARVMCTVWCGVHDLAALDEPGKHKVAGGGNAWRAEHPAGVARVHLRSEGGIVLRGLDIERRFFVWPPAGTSAWQSAEVGTVANYRVTSYAPEYI